MHQPAIAERFPSIIPFRKPGEDSGFQLLTLFEIYERFVEPEQFDNAPATRSDYRTSLRRWISSTGNPPVCEIEDSTMQAFRDSFPPSMSAKTVQKHLKNIGRVLRRCGPYDPYNNREGMDLIRRIPWCKPPRWKKADRKRVNRIISAERMELIYRNCSVMDWPGKKCRSWNRCRIRLRRIRCSVPCRQSATVPRRSSP